MRDYRIVMAGESGYWFVIYAKAINEREAVSSANKQYAPAFEVQRDKVTEIMK